MKTQALYFMVFLCRYVDLFWNFHSLYNSVMKCIYIGSTGYIVYMMRYKQPYKSSYSPEQDHFPVLALIVPCICLSLVVNWYDMYVGHGHFHLSEVVYVFSIFLEAVAIVPQNTVIHDFARNNSGFVENLTSHYVFALGGYRFLYIMNWVYRYATEDHYSDRVVWFSGVVQTAMYVDFFYYYFKAMKSGKKMSLPI